MGYADGLSLDDVIGLDWGGIGSSEVPQRP